MVDGKRRYSGGWQEAMQWWRVRPRGPPTMSKSLPPRLRSKAEAFTVILLLVKATTQTCSATQLAQPSADGLRMPGTSCFQPADKDMPTKVDGRETLATR